MFVVVIVVVDVVVVVVVVVDVMDVLVVVIDVIVGLDCYCRYRRR